MDYKFGVLNFNPLFQFMNLIATQTVVHKMGLHVVGTVESNIKGIKIREISRFEDHMKLTFAPVFLKTIPDRLFDRSYHLSITFLIQLYSNSIKHIVVQ